MNHHYKNAENLPPTNALQKIKLLILDVDGVLTDGSVTYSDNGIELKTFNIKDGLGIKLLMQKGVEVAVITGRKSDALTRRLKELGVDHVYDGVKNKLVHFEALLSLTQTAAEETAFMGDDLPDLPLFSRVGLSIAVADAQEDVKKYAAFTTVNKGGAGAVREVAEKILKSRGEWEGIVSEYQS